MKTSSEAAISRTTTANDAILLAAEDLAQIERTCSIIGAVFEPFRYRYVWVQDGKLESQATVAFTVNSVISRSSINFAPNKGDSPIQYRGGGHLVRIDLKKLCPKEGDFEKVAKLWDKIPNPYLMFTPSIHAFGQDIEQDPFFGPHVDIRVASSLQALTNSINPVVASHSFHISALTTADGGLYYKFKDVPVAEKKSQSDFDVILKNFGVPEKLIRELGADQWIAMTDSGVTGKPRRVIFFDRPAPTGNIQGWISITYDTLDKNRDPKSHPLKSLLEFQHDGTEVIIEQDNGHLLFLLYDGKGKLVDEAPPDLVSDTTIPDPHTKRLQCAISCIRCHGANNQNGWKDFRNDIPLLVNATGLDISADITANSLGLSRDESFELLTRLYDNDLQKPLRRAREDQSEVILKSTFGATNSEGLPWSYADVSVSLTNIFERDFYGKVGPIEACRDLGWIVTDEKEATTLFALLMGAYQPVPGTTFIQEDPAIGIIKQGFKMPHRDWDASYIDAAARAAANEQFIRGKK